MQHLQSQFNYLRDARNAEGAKICRKDAKRWLKTVKGIKKHADTHTHRDVCRLCTEKWL